MQTSVSETNATPSLIAAHKDDRPTARIRPWAAVGALAWREWIRFFRQRSRVIGALGQPILFWLLFGVGMSSMFTAGEMPFREYFFPGTMMLILLFTSIFASISIIEDRHEGFLQGVLVSPVPRWSAVLGKVLGCTVIAMFQASLFFGLSLTLGVPWHWISVAGVLLWLCLCAAALAALGFVLAWWTDSTQGFHAMMSLLLLPMWLLSGAFFPVPEPTAGAGWGPLIMHGIMRINPLTYAMAGLRRILYLHMPERIESMTEHGQIWLPSLPICVIVLLGFTLFMFIAAWLVSGRRSAGDLR